MIIPYGHERTVSRVPYLTFAIVAVCTLVQLYSTLFAPDLDAIRDAMARADSPEELRALVASVDPDKIPILRFGYEADRGWTFHLITSAFVHAGWLHLVGNMLFLWLAGSALEDRLGRVRFAILYLAGAVVATLCWDRFHEGQATIIVGASGAVSALLGAFLVYFASTRVLLWYWIMMRSGTFRMAAYLVLPLWLGEQVLYAYLQHAETRVDHVAYAAHIGGFVFGLAVALLAKQVFRIGSETDELDRLDQSEEVVVAPANRVDAAYQKCLDAATSKDAGALRTMASRVILDLARAGDDTRIFELYRAISHRLVQRPLTDGAFLAAAKAAQTLNHQRTYVEILECALREQPGSRLAPEFQARLAATRR